MNCLSRAMIWSMAAHPLFFLVLALCSVSISASTSFVSIDCGSSNTYTDKNLIQWRGDDNYTKNGVSRSVQSINSISHVMDTMRVFTTRKKNCYKIDSVTKGRVLVRASFFYGNYDEKNSPPSFDLQFDGNDWGPVQTSSIDVVYREVIYTMKNDWISVCVAQTKTGQFPFISAIEVRVLETYMYDQMNENYPLFKIRRFAYGANATIRYPDDTYDRLWTPIEAGNGYTDIHSDAVFDSSTSARDNPPPAVLRNAITPFQPNGNITLNTGFPPVEIPVYLIMYFSEVAQLKPNDTRSFSVFKNNLSYSDPFSPPYKNCTELYATPVFVSSNTTLSLVPMYNSTLPPLINAMEIYLIGDPVTNGTNSADVAGLTSLQKAFVVLQDWSGDPCLPAPYTWDWIDCTNETTPRVTALYLSSYGMSGVLPDFSTMDALQTIDLHNNSLQGPIPSFLGTFPELKLLNLGTNHFNGSIPASLSKKTGLNLVVTGNPDLCTSGCSNVSSPSGDPSKSSPPISNNNIVHLPVIIIFGTTIPTLITTLFITGVLLHHY